MSVVIVLVTGAVLAQSEAPRATGGPQFGASVYGLYGLGDTGLPSPAWPPAADRGFRGPAMS
jgi:hypothetical protein